MMRTRISIPEPEIRVYLQKKYGVKDQSTINTHLHSLEKLGCIDLIPPDKEVTRANQWGIETLDNLKNIRQHFPDIPLNKYEKSLQIVSENRLLHRNYPRHNVFCVYLMLSSSFGDAYVKTDIMSSTKAAYEIYRFGEGYDEDKKIKTCIDEVYTNFVKRIFIRPDIWLSIWNTYIKDPLKPEIHQKSLPCPPIIEISKETFQEMLKKTTFPEKRIPEEMSGRKILKEMTLQLSYEILQKTLSAGFVYMVNILYLSIRVHKVQKNSKKHISFSK